MARDFLEELIAERQAKNPQFNALVAEAEARQALAKKLAVKRQKRKLSQTMVAALMGTSQSVVSKIEAGGDVRLSTFQRYASIVGARLSVGT